MDLARLETDPRSDALADALVTGLGGQGLNCTAARVLRQILRCCARLITPLSSWKSVLCPKVGIWKISLTLFGGRGRKAGLRGPSRHGWPKTICAAA